MKSECPHIRQLLSEYIDGVLDVSKMTSVREHLHICEDCSHEHNLLISLTNNLGKINVVNAPDNFLEKLHERIGRDSFFERIKGLFSLRRINIPVELAAFAATAMLILFLFNLFPAEEKGIVKTNGNDDMKLAMNQETSPVQTAINQDQQDRSAGYDASYTTNEKGQQEPVSLTLTLTARRQITALPSQSVSYGNPEYGFADNDPYLLTSEQGNVVEDRLLQPDEVNQKIDDILRAVGGKLISREDDPDTGYPALLTIETQAINYPRFLLRIGDLGELKTPAPVLSHENGKATVLIRMKLSPKE